MAAYTAIDDSEAYFQTKLYTGTGSSLAVTLDGEEDMAPDMIWIKKRSDVGAHYIYDAVRGTFKHLNVDETTAENTDDSPYGLSAFSSNGFTIGTGGDVNGSSATQVAWCWKMGTTSGIGGSPSITPSGYSFSATARQSIIAYTGTGSEATLPHGLGVTPDMLITKIRVGGTFQWAVYHHKNTAAPETDYLYLNTTDATTDDVNLWNDTAPDSSVFTVYTSNRNNKSSGTYVAYCFASVQGFSKFGSYKGNGNADGTFVYTGFRPAWLMIKRTDEAAGWYVWDSKRTPYNLAQGFLAPDTDAAENTGTSNAIDILSNGFKARSSNDDTNDVAGTFIYAAFAEAPFVNSNGVPCNAR